MSITSAIVLYAVIWFMVFLIAIPIRLKTQGEAGHIVPGTHAGSPEDHGLGRKARITTLVSAAIWAVLFAIIATGAVTVRDIDVFGRMPPLEEDG